MVANSIQNNGVGTVCDEDSIGCGDGVVCDLLVELVIVIGKNHLMVRKRKTKNASDGQNEGNIYGGQITKPHLVVEGK